MLKSNMHTYAHIHNARCERLSRLVAGSESESSAFGGLWRAATADTRQQSKQLVMMSPPSLVFAFFTRCSRKEMARVLEVWRRVTENEDTLTVDFSMNGVVSRMLNVNHGMSVESVSTLCSDWEIFREGRDELPPLELWNSGSVFLLANVHPCLWQEPQGPKRGGVSSSTDSLMRLEQYLGNATVRDKAVFAAWFQSLFNFSRSGRGFSKICVVVNNLDTPWIAANVADIASVSVRASPQRCRSTGGIQARGWAGVDLSTLSGMQAKWVMAMMVTGVDFASENTPWVLLAQRFEKEGAVATFFSSLMRKYETGRCAVDDYSVSAAEFLQRLLQEAFFVELLRCVETVEGQAGADDWISVADPTGERDTGFMECEFGDGSFSALCLGSPFNHANWGGFGSV
jgi:hypothetical protein